MKKFFLPIILAAVLGIGGGVTAVMINRANTASADDTNDELPPMVEVKSGNYYLNGDKNSDLWIEVNPEFLILKGKDIDKSIEEALSKLSEGEDLTNVTKEEVSKARQWEFDECKMLYCTEKKYLVQPIGLKDVPYSIKVSRHNDENTSEELSRSNAGFKYGHDTNTINLSLFGDFILVE